MSAITDLPARVQALISERRRHEETVSEIDKTLATIDQTLADIAAPFGVPAPRTLGRPAGAPGDTAKPRRRRSRGSYATTGEESVLAFIKQHKNPTTSEVKAHWAGESRRGTADNVLSKLFREKRVKRKPLGKGIRGSRYSLA